MTDSGEQEKMKQQEDVRRASQLKAIEEQAASARDAAAQAAESRDAAHTAAVQAAASRDTAQTAANALDQRLAAAPSSETEKEPKRRHEFVGMMFAVAIGEVGVQTASLVRAGNWIHFLPAYSHLFLTTIVIAASWVGWTVSPAPGARRDVRSIFNRDFLVLLVDVFLVVVYFILAKTVDLVGEKEPKLNASARPETLWILVIFGTYVFWDVLTKFLDFLETRNNPPEGRKKQSFKEWCKEYGIRMLPTIFCFLVLWFTKRIFDAADAPHVLTADLALLSLVLLFRALKGLTKLVTEPTMKKGWLILWTCLCIFGFAIGTKWTCSWPMFQSVADEIQNDAGEQRNHPDLPESQVAPNHVVPSAIAEPKVEQKTEPAPSPK
jgi:hypothetical protein